MTRSWYARQLGIACAVAGTALALVYTHSLAGADKPVVPPASMPLLDLASSIGLNPLAALDSFAQIVERPLFRKDRRPRPNDEEPIAIAALDDPIGKQSEQLRLQGTLIRRDGNRALILAGNNAKAVWVASGERVGGWSVTAIKTSQVELEAEGRRLSLKLRPEKDRRVPRTLLPMLAKRA